VFAHVGRLRSHGLLLGIIRKGLLLGIIRKGM